MRSVLNISLPLSMVKLVKKEVREGGFASVSEFFRHLLRLWNTEKLAYSLGQDKKKFDNGEGVELNSLKDLR